MDMIPQKYAYITDNIKYKATDSNGQPRMVWNVHYFLAAQRINLIKFRNLVNAKNTNYTERVVTQHTTLITWNRGTRINCTKIKKLFSQKYNLSNIFEHDVTSKDRQKTKAQKYGTIYLTCQGVVLVIF